MVVLFWTHYQRFYLYSDFKEKILTFFCFFSYTLFMKNLEKEKLKTLLSIIKENPSLDIAHFTDQDSPLVELLNDYTRQHGYGYQLNLLDNAIEEPMSQRYKSSSTKVNFFHLQRKSYLIQAKQYDFVFVTANIEEEIESDFLKRLHQVIRNAGNLIVFIKKEDYMLRYRWIELLEEHNYVATNTIDNLCNDYDIVITKKMHGWGK